MTYDSHSTKRKRNQSSGYTPQQKRKACYLLRYRRGVHISNGCRRSSRCTYVNNGVKFNGKAEDLQGKAILLPF